MLPLLSHFRRTFADLGLIVVASAIASTVVIGIREMGWLQPLELGAYDRLMQLRPMPGPDPRLLVVAVTEADIQRYRSLSLPDQIYAQALKQLLKHQPRAIGLDIYRDFAVPPGHEELNRLWLSSDRLFAVTKLGDATHPTIRPSAALSADQVGFNDVTVDAGGIVRRSLLFLPDDQGNTLYSFSLRLALRYLADGGIEPRGSDADPNVMQLGQSIFTPLQPNDGGYVGADTAGYQIMLNYRGDQRAVTWVPLEDVLNGRVAPALIRDRVVLIGNIAESGKDFFYTPFSSGLRDNQRMAGVFIHAQMVGQFIDAGLGDRAVIWFWPNSVENVWIVLWALIGAILAWRVRHPLALATAVGTALLILLLACYGLFLKLGWVPLVPPALTLLLGSGGVVTYTAQQAQQQRQMVMRLLGQNISPEIAAAMWERRDELLKDGKLPGQRLIATLLFTDLKGFSTISEGMEPEELFNWLNAYLEKVADVVQSYHGVINKFTGDGIMAVFGVPIKRTSREGIAIDARNAVDCALALGQLLEELNREWAAQGLPQVMMRAGIYTGPIVVGSLGSKNRLEYGVIGDSVNTASRLESVDKHRQPSPCRILVAQETLEYLGDRYEVEAWGPLELKGKERKIQVFRILGVREGLAIAPNQPTAIEVEI
ncbi:adenylate/guanylate cyclase domain-containing protein [Thermosynechococcus sp. GLH187]|uniref:CHASE2 domain-containing protein n=1 Tax=unclassified Thermosynechococcus TaxID=2622553 RepID=UPI002877EEFD|nr:MULTISPECIES: adenylate/guanylate cyclase domain-containing protein [unclassified Thermosynechococcus]WNC44356.1 adenylate/guanylate cyclase domain-containing protein [Thermosynechococcus sp. GLH187]WNC46892.1 adenylate/guanylate cyclase domain-containing protein [Thermosynechococcus sp. GLH333]WNC49429.1 adenylate/guanylate cyclase domain-containing protein [Thermosynechococcus sp. GLH87]